MYSDVWKFWGVSLSDGRKISLVILFRNNLDANRDTCIFLCLKANQHHDSRNSFLKSRLANRGPEVFSNRVLLYSGAWWSSERLDDLTNAIEEAVLTVFPHSETHCGTQCVITTLRRSLAWPCINLLPLIAHAIRTSMHPSMHRHWQATKPNSCSGNAFALGWSAQKLLSASEKSVTLNAIVIHVLQTLLQMRYFLPSENALWLLDD